MSGIIQHIKEHAMLGVTSSTPPVVSAAVRSGPATTIATVNTGQECRTFREFHKTNVQVDRPYYVWANSYNLTSGITPSTAGDIAAANAIQHRAAILTGVSGTAANQGGTTVWKCRYYGMLKDPAFLKAGGSVSGDGYTITIPPGIVIQSDPIPGLRLTSGQAYIFQLEELYTAAALSRMGGLLGVTALGDRYWVSSTANQPGGPVYSGDWSVSYAGVATGGGANNAFSFPLAILGEGSPGTRVVGIDGDSIAYGTTDVGDGNGVLGAYAKALNAAGYSFLYLPVPGTNIGQRFSGYLPNARLDLLRHCDAVITNHGHNDEGGSYTSSAFIALARQNWSLLKAKMKPTGARRVIQATLTPSTNSGDGWASQTTTSQPTFKSAEATYPNGAQFSLADYVMRRGPYAGVPFSDPNDPSAGYDFYAAIGGANGLWPAAGTADGTHPASSLFALAAADLQPRLPGLLGW